MKLSISLPKEDVAALDRYAKAAGITTRSAAIAQAIRMLRDPHLDDAYAAAWEEWESSGEAAAWEETTADGLADAAR
ncbi:MAG: ribbon-helix-helix domain-containing protein [Intrasporangium sp.]|uniref:ribbon-helix-helix domain-containing protein n=1 Tax=Intrasporangium sp. TaxID=1925024 RepID=UPI002648F972|nr:ribbon-helix-helix domain-containing protein [Intrasporangium sp.]MDN5794403.1 ribbon-helix-helix domain-containing protein [Intrasporangium sp.]